MARKPYLNEAGKRVPATTTITGKFGNKDGIIWWANAVGLGERDCDDQKPCRHCGRRAGKRHRDAKGAAQVGSLAHSLIEQRVKGVDFDMAPYDHFTQEQTDQVDQCMIAFDRWWKAYAVEVIETELSLVSEKHQYGGMFDAIGRVAGTFSLIDWKTSKGVYPEYVAQLAGYLILIEEAGFPEVEEIHLLRVSKDTAAFEHRSWPRRTFAPAIDYFLEARSLYGASAKLDALLK